MKIGFIVQGSTDRAFVRGLRDRWCPEAELVSLGFRGSELRPRKYPAVCDEGRLKGCDVVVILTDTDLSPLNVVYKDERACLTPTVRHYVVLGVAQLNIECWICADADYVARCCSCDAGVLKVSDPKRPFERAIGITRDDKKEGEIAKLVREYPSMKPMLNLKSFERFYNEAVDFAQQNECAIPNERDT